MKKQRYGIDKLLSQRRREGIANKVKPKRANIEWLRRYESQTTFEPMDMEEYLDGDKSFRDLVWENATWFQDWSNDAHLAITRDLPKDAQHYT